MTTHFIRAIDGLKAQLLSLTTLVEESLQRAMRAMRERNSVLAQEVVNSDEEIDSREVEIEEECLKILALHQPVAIDLRFLVAVLKINNDLERIGDLSINIASRALALSTLPPAQPAFDLSTFANKAQALFQKAIKSLIDLDTTLAREVCNADKEIDEMYREMYKATQATIEANPNATAQMLNFLSIARNLERIGDHATNIAEDVVYMIEGDIIRHKADKKIKR